MELYGSSPLRQAFFCAVARCGQRGGGGGVEQAPVWAAAALEWVRVNLCYGSKGNTPGTLMMLGVWCRQRNCRDAQNFMCFTLFP